MLPMRVERPTYKIVPDGPGKSKALDDDGATLCRLWNIGSGQWRASFDIEVDGFDQPFPSYTAAEKAVRRVIESWD